MPHTYPYDEKLLFSVLALGVINPNPVLIEEKFGLMKFNLIFVVRLVILMMVINTLIK